jgi:hypothetical protein
MHRKTLKVIGYLQILIVVLFFLAASRFSKGPFVFPVYFKISVYVILALLSSIGIIFIKKIPFLTTVYLYTFLIMERIERIFIIKTDNVSSNSKFYVSEMIFGGIVLSVCLGIILLVLSKNVRDYYAIEQKTALINLSVAIVLAFFIGPAYIPIINKVAGSMY